MKKAISIAVLLCLTLLLSQGCEESLGCQVSTTIPARAGFYTFNTDSSETATLANEVSLKGIGADSLIIANQEVGLFNFYLDPYQDSCAFLLTIAAQSDTLSFTYSRSLELLSEECGFITTFEVNAFKSTYNGIDSVALIENSVNTENDQHIKIYL